MTAQIEINRTLLSQIDKELAGMKMLSRMPAIKAGLRAAGKVVSTQIRATLPLPGYPGDKKDLTPLRDTVATKVVEYPSGVIVALVGYNWHGGQHGHNVEEGHNIVVGGTSANPVNRKTPRVSKVEGRTGKGNIQGRVAGRFDIANAAKATETQQAIAISGSIQTAVEQARRA